MVLSMTNRLAWCVLVLACAFLPGRASADAASEGTVSGSGTASIKRQADVLRMEVSIVADGKDAAAAVAKLKEMQAAAKAKLLALGAAENSVDVGTPRPQVSNDRQQQMQRMVRMRVQQGKKPTSQPAAEPMAVTATVKAEWPLQKASPEETLVAAMQLQQKIKAANLMAAKKQASTPEEQEEMDESSSSSFDNGEAPAAGTPTFVYVCKVSAEDRAKATAEAFGKAKAQAERLATAAGASLGGIRQLGAQAGPDYDESMQYNNYYRRYMYGMQQNAGGSDDNTEAIGSQPGEVALRVMVTATFSLK